MCLCLFCVCPGRLTSTHPRLHVCHTGRLPIRVELKGLTEEDMYRILTEPVTNLIAQQVRRRHDTSVSVCAHCVTCLQPDAH